MVFECGLLFVDNVDIVLVSWWMNLVLLMFGCVGMKKFDGIWSVDL